MKITANGAEYDSILEALKAERVFDISTEADGMFTVQENCDGWFYLDLTREQLSALADEIRALANER